MSDPDAAPQVPSPEDALDPVREQSHEETGLPEKVADLERHLEEAEARERELKDRLARLQADFENFRRRAREDAAAAQSKGKEALVRTLLPLLDNLDRALAHHEDEGLRLLSRQLHEVLREAGVVVLAPEGEAFDAKLHEAVAQEAKDGAKAGTILSVLEKGYTLEGRVLRPARVIVAA